MNTGKKRKRILVLKLQQRRSVLDLCEYWKLKRDFLLLPKLGIPRKTLTARKNRRRQIVVRPPHRYGGVLESSGLVCY